MFFIFQKDKFDYYSKLCFFYKPLNHKPNTADEKGARSASIDRYIRPNNTRYYNDNLYNDSQYNGRYYNKHYQTLQEGAIKRQRHDRLDTHSVFLVVWFSVYVYLVRVRRLHLHIYLYLPIFIYLFIPRSAWKLANTG